MHLHEATVGLGARERLRQELHLAHQTNADLSNHALQIAMQIIQSIRQRI